MRLPRFRWATRMNMTGFDDLNFDRTSLQTLFFYFLFSRVAWQRSSIIKANHFAEAFWKAGNFPLQ